MDDNTHYDSGLGTVTFGEIACMCFCFHGWPQGPFLDLLWFIR